MEASSNVDVKDNNRSFNAGLNPYVNVLKEKLIKKCIGRGDLGILLGFQKIARWRLEPHIGYCR